MNTFVIEREKLIENANIVRERAGDADVIAVVKGHGYGFGIDTYVALLHECGIRRFAVTEPEDAVNIRALALEDTDILMLRSTALPDELSMLIDYNVTLTIGSYDSAVAANGIAAEKGVCARVHVKVDTGMGRYGFDSDDIEQIASVYTNLPSVKVEGLYTHLTSAFRGKKTSVRQIEKLYAVRDALSAREIDCGMLHFANSAYLFRFPKAPHGDAVRIGSAFTGRLPCNVRHTGLSRVGYLESRVCEMHWLRHGATVGYGSVFKVRKPVRTAVIPVGYVSGFCMEKARDSYRFRDGVSYALSDLKRALLGRKVYVQIGGHPARVLGHIGMTHTVCDVTDIPCAIGDKAVFAVNTICVDSSIPKLYE